NHPPLGNRTISRAATFHRSEIAESHALESSTARKLQNSTRRNHPPLRNRRISRAATFHRPRIAESRRGNIPSLRNCRIPRAATFHHSGIAESHARSEERRVGKGGKLRADTRK